MAYTPDIDPVARAQIRELPPAGAVALADALAVLELVPERGEPLNADNPDPRTDHLPAAHRSGHAAVAQDDSETEHARVEGDVGGDHYR